MKQRTNLFVIMMALISCFGFLSCNKPEYNPDRKISRIYESYKNSLWYNDVLATSGESSKDLTMIWNWEKNKLTRIDQPDWSINFIYEKNQLTKVQYGDMESVFTYGKGKVREKAEVFYAGKLMSLINYTYTNDQVSKIVFTMYDSDEIYRDKTFTDKYKAVSRFLLPECMNRQLFAHKMQQKSKNGSKSNSYTFEYHFTYTGNNVSQLKMVYPGYDEEEESYTFKYDTKNNPFYHSLFQFDGNMVIGNSENNIISIYDGDGDLEESLSYKYDGDWPTQAISKYEASYPDYDYETGQYITVREVSEYVISYEYLKD